MAEPQWLRIGAAVRLHGLQSKSAFEGRAGVVRELLRLDGAGAPSHAQVELNDGRGGESLRVRVERLIPNVQQQQRKRRRREQSDGMRSHAPASDVVDLCDSDDGRQARPGEVVDLCDDDSDDDAGRNKAAREQRQRTLQEMQDAAFARRLAEEEREQRRQAERVQLDQHVSENEDDDDESQPYDPAKDIIYAQRSTLAEVSQF
jgi:hypothetical protein